MQVTVCQLSDQPDDFAREWDRLVAHVNTRSSDLVLLPEMPFHPWFGATPDFDPVLWQAAVVAHDAWQSRLRELTPATVLGSRPVNKEERRLNEGFVWTQQGGSRAAHVKSYLPNEEGVWETSWYDKGDGDFTPFQVGGARIGFSICTELWAMEHARHYGKQGVQVIATPRMTSTLTLDKWLVGGRVAAIISGAFSISSNRAGPRGGSSDFGGQGWIIGPDGQVLGLTSHRQPFLTVEIDLAEADRAKWTYPRYALE